MMRPFTLICMLAAFGAGLYLYQSKHQAQMLDREIGRTIKATEATRDRTGMLRAEWALLNEPDRLAELARAHTALQTLKPTQFVGLTDLAARLPAPMVNNREKLPTEAEPEEAPPVPVAQAPVAAPAPATPAKPREIAAAEPKPKTESKPDVKPVTKVAAVEAKPVVKHVEKPAMVAALTQAPVLAEPVRPRMAPPHAQPEIVSNEATAPGTVGAAVLRAMRAQNAGFAQPVSAAPAYVQPAYAQPTYSPPAYAAPAPSVLGGRSALPPPVPFAAR